MAAIVAVAADEGIITKTQMFRQQVAFQRKIESAREESGKESLSPQEIPLNFELRRTCSTATLAVEMRAKCGGSPFVYSLAERVSRRLVSLAQHRKRKWWQNVQHPAANHIKINTKKRNL